MSRKVNLVELSDNLATEVMEKMYGSHNLYRFSKREGCDVFKRKYQPIYNNFYDKFYEILENAGIKHENI